MIFNDAFAFTLMRFGFFAAYQALGFLNAGLILFVLGVFLSKPCFERAILSAAIFGICWVLSMVIGGMV